MSSFDLTRDWLRSVLRPYPARETLEAEVLRTLQRLPSLSVKTAAFSASHLIPFPLPTPTNTQPLTRAQPPSFYSYTARYQSPTGARGTTSPSTSGFRTSTPAPRPSSLSCRQRTWACVKAAKWSLGEGYAKMLSRACGRAGTRRGTSMRLLAGSQRFSPPCPPCTLSRPSQPVRLVRRVQAA
jgi:hypothetical protein